MKILPLYYKSNFLKMFSNTKNSNLYLFVDIARQTRQLPNIPAKMRQLISGIGQYSAESADSSPS